MTRLGLAVALVLALVLPAVAADHPLLVTPAWVAERLGRADVRIIDLSDAEDYARGHIPGAVHLDFTDTRPQASEGVFRAPTAEEGRRLFARLGITPDTTVIVYDDEGGLHAAWLFLVLDVLGHPRVSVLDGGSQRWRAGGGAWTTDVPRAPAPHPRLAAAPSRPPRPRGPPPGGGPRGPPAPTCRSRAERRVRWAASFVINGKRPKRARASGLSSSWPDLWAGRGTSRPGKAFSPPRRPSRRRRVECKLKCRDRFRLAQSSS